MATANIDAGNIGGGIMDNIGNVMSKANIGNNISNTLDEANCSADNNVFNTISASNRSHFRTTDDSSSKIFQKSSNRKRSRSMIDDEYDDDSMIDRYNSMIDRYKIHRYNMGNKGNDIDIELTDYDRYDYALNNKYTKKGYAHCNLGLTYTSKKDKGNWGIIDSGASHHMDYNIDHFEILYNEYCSLKVADRVVSRKAQYGKFHKNTLDLEYGLFHPDLNAMLVSVYREIESGNDVHFSKSNVNVIVNHKSKKIHEFCFRDQLPRIEIKFFKDCNEEGSSPIVEEQLAFRAAKTSVRDKFLQHVRSCHFYCDCVGNVTCSACMMMKDHGGVSHRSSRPDYLKSQKFLEQVNWDFSGKWPESLHKKEWLLVAVDDYVSWVEGYALKSKDQAGLALESFIANGPGLMDRTRTDNAPEFRGPKSAWISVHQKHKVKPTNSAQYEPQTNGKAERTIRTFGNAVRTVCCGVDIKLWEYAPDVVNHVFNRLDRKNGQKSPYYEIRQRDPKTYYFRRFGCLCYAKEQVLNRDKDIRSKVAVRYAPGVFLGYNKNSTYKVGVWRKDARSSTGWKFNVMENKTVKFDETRLIADINDLRSKGSFVSFVLPDALRDSVIETGDGGSVGADHPASVVPSLSRKGPLSKVDDSAVAQEDLSDRADESKTISDPPSIEPLFDGTDAQDHKESTSVDSNGRVDDSVIEHQDKPALLEDKIKVEPADDDPRIYIDENGVKRKRRGRLPGVKAKAHWKKTGPKPKVARTHLVFGDNKKRAMELEEAEEEMWNLFQEKREFDLENEEAVCFNVQLTYKKCMESEDSAKWIEADNLEKVKLTAKQCWRNIVDDDKFDYKTDEIIPIVCIYTKKRDGRYKCRAVALGNRQTACSKAEIYSPTVSHACNRYLCAHAAANGHHVLQFDITLAFINSTLADDRVFCKLPAHWGGEKVRLLRALYGLKVSPRKWFDTYRAYLEKTGWIMNDTEPGLFKKNGMLLSVYVDDSFISGPNLSDVKAEMNAILTYFEGKEVEPTKVHHDGTEERDLLGATLLYNRKKRYMKVHMKDAIVKVLKRFNMSDCKGAPTPAVANADLSAGGDNKVYPMRQLCGCLNYIATICRPDISFACHRLSQFADKCTGNAVNAGKRILKYLSVTLDQGVSYTVENEETFRDKYTKVLKEHVDENGDFKELPDNVAFTDADFCGCSVTLKSTSGSILYYRGCPIVWKSQRQSIRTHSTCESEYVSMYDVIRLCQSQGYLRWFLDNKSELPLIFSDNKAALALSKTSVATRKSKHYALRYMLVRDYFQNFGYVPSLLNLSDPLTKPLQGHRYNQMFDHVRTGESYDDQFAKCCYVNFETFV